MRVIAALLLCLSLTAQTATLPEIWVTDTGTKYHRPDCRYLRESGHIIIREEARQRELQPCSVCKPDPIDDLQTVPQ